MLIVFSLIFLMLPLMSIKGKSAVGDFCVVICCQYDGNGACFAPCPHSFIACLLFWVSKEEPGFGACLSVEGMLQVSPPEQPFGEVFIPLKFIAHLQTWSSLVRIKTYYPTELSESDGIFIAINFFTNVLCG